MRATRATIKASMVVHFMYSYTTQLPYRYVVSAAGRDSHLHFMTSDRPLLGHTRLAYQDETTGKLMDHYFFFLLLTTCISSGDQLIQRRIGKHSMSS